MPWMYLLIASGIWMLGFLHAGKYVQPRWKIPGKFLFYLSISGVIAHFWGPWSLLFIVGHPLIGLIFHIRACRKHAINWMTCEPIEEYKALQEKWARGEFD
ncbi:hypothetical protein [Pontibacter sp. G13]|uniref:hypothetical protein n=1 Tax=Pontibacter sp. G13 TaxID=3074898 RepID=UPI0028892F73|nr:hypothetical protein [Pontibacter sp. G13]WNJ20102.1 hypothetical protein RJD25_06420 [Pontibacter sp. G13]